MKLSILILTISSRYAILGRLRDELNHQILDYAGDIEIRIHDGGSNIGQKRNELLQAAQGEYISFIDDDDEVSESYIRLLMEAIETGCDCASLIGQITFNGKDGAFFEHSIKYKEWKTNTQVAEGDITYERYPNHLNLIKASIAKMFYFPEVNHGEDKSWSDLIHESGLLKKEHTINEVIYFYKYISNK